MDLSPPIFCPPGSGEKGGSQHFTAVREVCYSSPWAWTYLLPSASCPSSVTFCQVGLMWGWVGLKLPVWGNNDSFIYFRLPRVRVLAHSHVKQLLFIQLLDMFGALGKWITYKTRPDWSCFTDQPESKIIQQHTVARPREGLALYLWICIPIRKWVKPCKTKLIPIIYPSNWMQMGYYPLTQLVWKLDTSKPTGLSQFSSDHISWIFLGYVRGILHVQSQDARFGCHCLAALEVLARWWPPSCPACWASSTSGKHRCRRCRQLGNDFRAAVGGFLSHGGSPSHHAFQYYS